MYIPCEASSWTLLHQNRKLSSRISLQNQLFCLCRLPAVYCSINSCFTLSFAQRALIILSTRDTHGRPILMVGWAFDGTKNQRIKAFVPISKEIRFVLPAGCLCSPTKEMISIFPLWTFHLYVATLQQHLHMEYISLSWYDIPELVVPIMISLIQGCC